MSAQLSSKASENFGPDKKFDSISHDPSANHNNRGAEVMSDGGRSEELTANPATNLLPLRLLVVDDSIQVRQMCCEVAEYLGFVVVETEAITAAREILLRKDTAILMLDLTRPEGEGQSLLAEMRSLYPDTLVIGMSASATIDSAVETMRSGACDYLSKPFPLHVLTEALERAARRRYFDVERRQLQEAMDRRSGMGHVLGRSVEMEKLYRMLSKVAGSTHPVMIVGENGTGKALVARSIHSNGPDASKPFISVDCKSMSPSSLENVLFGRLKSSSGKVDMQTRGLLASLEGGTVFLDEIGDLPPDLQGKLAKALKEKKIWPVGGTRAHNLSVRILVATDRNLTQMVRDGYFRMDLYGLLSLVNLKIPPLRGRPDDIAFLAERFLERSRRKTGISRTLSKETLRMLETYDWPENIRELEVVITRAYTLSPGPELEIDHLPLNVLTFCRRKEAERKRDFTLENNRPFKGSIIPIATMEKRAILKAMQQTNGNKAMAINLLGIGKTTLYRKLKEYGLDVKTRSAASPAEFSYLTSEGTEPRLTKSEDKNLSENNTTPIAALK